MSPWWWILAPVLALLGLYLIFGGLLAVALWWANGKGRVSPLEILMAALVLPWAFLVGWANLGGGDE